MADDNETAWRAREKIDDAVHLLHQAEVELQTARPFDAELLHRIGLQLDGIRRSLRRRRG
ncbi:hypothetical protein [Microbacterium sp.]|uniref:hypothetical protein n=1 Tax=Microbacterium sp. TaxID=51671 RepID=UPI002E2F3169|nr:hypothetical protein [Microbacterium sp.]HEX5728448.1 hypothetical protein [Microbacterium sp.]